MPRVLLRPWGLEVEAEAGLTLLQAARRAGLAIASYCGGRGLCGKCRVVVEEGAENLSRPTPREEEVLGELLDRGSRLACEARVLSGRVVVLVPPESLLTRERLVAKPLALRDDVYPLKPAVRKVYLELRPPSLEDNRPDFERLVDSLVEVGALEPGAEVGAPLELLRELPRLLRLSEWRITAVLYGESLLALEPGDTRSELYGLAVDVGTSKILAHLVDLNTGKTLAEDSVENPQLSRGADVVSRMAFAEESPQGLSELSKLALSAISDLALRLSKKAGVRPERVYEVVVVGNTVMHHLLFHIPLSGLAYSPYVPAVSRSLSCSTRELGLSNVNPRGRVYALPIIGGYVGADASANILATQLHKKKGPLLVIDIGTNTEVLLGGESGAYAASAPSGPAFEGMHISHGMRAVPGAISSVKVTGGGVEYETIGGGRPRGICGSGLVELLAELYRSGVLDYKGRFIRGSHPRLVCEPPPCRFIVVPAAESATGSDIYVTAKDVEALLLAKAAVQAAWRVLLEKAGVGPGDLEGVYVAGSFGASLGVDSAIELGLIPPVEKSRVVFVGESAIVGAKVALKSIDARREVEEFARERVKYVELSADPLFKKAFTESMRLGA
ncbi:MAG: ASKHA domain-containing protein [Desulfurococcaceae archaeon]